MAAAAAVVPLAYSIARARPTRLEVRGRSMEPVLRDGDRALALAARRFHRGDVVVVEHPHRPGFEIVKRLVALPGETAPDGRPLLPEEFWVEGDRPEASTDSRSFGPVVRASLSARVRLVYWPPAHRRLVGRRSETS